jgi:hypothetical protein
MALHWRFGVTAHAFQPSPPFQACAGGGAFLPTHTVPLLANFAMRGNRSPIRLRHGACAVSANTRRHASSLGSVIVSLPFCP